MLMRPRRATSTLLVVLCLSACGGSSGGSGSQGTGLAGADGIEVLSNRPDLVSGGDALVAVALPAGADPSTVRMDLDGQDVTNLFAVRADGRYLGLLTGLDDGKNILTAR